MRNSRYYHFLLLFCLANLLFVRADDKITRKMDDKISSIIESIKTPVIPNRTINLCTFSGHFADEDGTYDFYNDIRNAIDSLSAQGGGILLFCHSQGTKAFVKQTEIFSVKGPIILKSNIELRFQPHTKLRFEFSPSSYLPNKKPVLTRFEGTNLYSFCPMIYAFNAQNIAITCSGGYGAMPVIDGNGEKWQKWQTEGDARVRQKGIIPATFAIRSELNGKDVPLSKRICCDTSYHYLRPALIQFIHCQRIKVEGVKLTNSPFWVVHPVFSTDITIRDIKYDCQVFNNDGVDVESSSNVLIENVIFDNHDDNIAIKSGRDNDGRDGSLVSGTEYEKINSPFIKNGRVTAPTTNVVVRNCVFKGHNAMCIGSEISGGASEIYVTDCFAPQEVMMGVYLKSSRKRGGVVHDIYVNNLSFQKIRNDAICIIPNYDDDTKSLYPTIFRDVFINNIKVKQSGNGIRIFGWEDALIENVTLNNIRIDTVLSTSSDKINLVNQVKNVVYKNISINGKLYNEKFNKHEKNAYPPKQK